MPVENFLKNINFQKHIHTSLYQKIVEFSIVFIKIKYSKKNVDILLDFIYNMVVLLW